MPTCSPVTLGGKNRGFVILFTVIFCAFFPIREMKRKSIRENTGLRNVEGAIGLEKVLYLFQTTTINEWWLGTRMWKVPKYHLQVTLLVEGAGCHYMGVFGGTSLTGDPIGHHHGEDSDTTHHSMRFIRKNTPVPGRSFPQNGRPKSERVCRPSIQLPGSHTR